MFVKRLKKILPPFLGFLLTVGILGWYVEVKAPPPKLAPLVVATANVPAGTLIGPGDVRLIRAQAGDVLPGSLTATSQAIGREAGVTVVAGQPLFRADLGRLPILRLGLEPGQEGVTIKLSNPNEVAGLAPGDWVKVYAFPQIGASGTGEPFILRARLIELIASDGQEVASGSSAQVTDARIAVAANGAAALLAAAHSYGGLIFTVAPWPEG